MLYYIRDDIGNLIGFKYNDTQYYYIKNLQEDIIGIVDSNFNRVVTYKYDAMGKLNYALDASNNIITNTNHIAYINPFRYRSYYYDNETNLYYLNSRYYNPEWGRFISPDTTILDGPYGANLYKYANNNFVNLAENGNFGWWIVAAPIICATVGLVTKIVSNIVNDNKWHEGCLGSLAGGLATGVLLVKTRNPKKATVGGAIVENTVNEAVKYISSNKNKKKVTVNNIVASTVDTGINSAVQIGTSLAIGEIAGQFTPKIQYNTWIQPEKFSTSFTGNYAQKVFIDNSITGGFQIATDTSQSLIEKTITSEQPIINVFPGSKSYYGLL